MGEHHHHVFSYLPLFPRWHFKKKKKKADEAVFSSPVVAQEPKKRAWHFYLLLFTLLLGWFLRTFFTVFLLLFPLTWLQLAPRSSCFDRPLSTLISTPPTHTHHPLNVSLSLWVLTNPDKQNGKIPFNAWAAGFLLWNHHLQAKMSNETKIATILCTTLTKLGVVQREMTVTFRLNHPSKTLAMSHNHGTKLTVCVCLCVSPLWILC